MVLSRECYRLLDCQELGWLSGRQFEDISCYLTKHSPKLLETEVVQE